MNGDFNPIVDGIVVTGNAGNNALAGTEFNDQIFGLGGNDALIGMAGQDLLLGGIGDDALFGNAGEDKLGGGLGDDQLIGGQNNDWLFGGAGDDFLWGVLGNDDLNGGAGRDYLNGGAGDDFLNGGQDQDYLLLKGGADIAVLQPGNGLDIVLDYQDGQDKLQVNLLTFSDLAISPLGSQHTLISVDQPGSNFDGQGLAVLRNTSSQLLNIHDFIFNQASEITSSSSNTVPENQLAAIDVQAIDDIDSEGSGLSYSLTGGTDQSLFNIDAQTGFISFKNAPDFENPADADTDNNYQLQVTVADYGSLIDVQDITITVADVNEAPIITTSNTVSVPENQTNVIDVNAIDPEGETENGGGLTYGLTGGDDQDLFDIDANTGEITFKNAPDFENPLDADGDNTYEILVGVTDSGGLSSFQKILVSVTNVNEAPTITSTNTVEVPENKTDVIDVDSTDPEGETENDGGLTYSITGGDDQGLFDIDENTGEVSFIDAPDFEVPGDLDLDNVYQLQVTVTDSGGLTNVQDIEVTVTNINEAPTITSANTVEVPENQIDVIDVDSTDPEGETENGGGLTYSITGGEDQGLFSIDANTGEVSFIDTPDFENPGDVDLDNVYKLQITVTDSGGLTDVQDIEVTVTDVNEAPTITSADTVEVPENQTDVIDVDSTDPEGETENGGGLTYSITGGDDQGLFNIDANTGEISFIDAPNFENPGDLDLDNAYKLEVTVTDSGGLTNVQNLEVTVTDVNETPPVVISPVNGEERVALTRETIVRFNKKVNPNTVTEDSFYLIANGERVPGRILVSSTEEFATFFYDEPLPQSTEVRVVVEGDLIIGRDGVAIDADNDGTPGGTTISDFRTLPLTQIEGTDVFGYIFDAYNRNPDGSNIPLEGVRISLDSLDISAVTDENGYFLLEDVPAPEFYVFIDGSEAEGAEGITQYASLGKPFESVPGQATQVFVDGEEFDIFLPPMSESDFVELSPTEDTDVGFGEASTALLQEAFPDVDPEVWARTQVTYPAGSAINDLGEPATRATIIPVSPDRLPAPLPEFIDTELVISIQAGNDAGFNREVEGGATNFDVPAPVSFPNLEGLAPREKSLLWSFNHDAGDWEVIGTGTVSEDGLVIESDEGVGIRAPGWHLANSGNQEGPNPNPSQQPPLTEEQLNDIQEEVEDFIFSAGPIVASLLIAATIPINISFFGLTAAAIGIAALTLKLGLELDGIINSSNVNENFSNNTEIDNITTFNPFSSQTRTLSDNLLTTNNISSISTGNVVVDQISDIVLDAVKIILPFALANQALPETINAQIEELLNEANELAGGNALEFIENMILDVEDNIATLPGNAPNYPVLYAAQIQRADSEIFTLRGQTLANGGYSLVVPREAEILSVSFFDPRTNSASVITPFVNPNAEFKLPRFTLVPIDRNFGDFDNDSLADIAEFVLGTNTNDTDTDGDGISDSAEIEQGLDPLGGRAFPTGVIANLPLRGEAKQVVVEGTTTGNRSQLSYVATGDDGLAIVDASQFNDPIVLGQIDLTGDAVDVAVDSDLNIAAVATGGNGLKLVDVSDPMLPTLIDNVPIIANQVEVFGGLAYTAVGNSITVIDLATAADLQNLNIPDTTTITGMAREGETLYIMDNANKLQAIDISGDNIVTQGSLVLPDGSGQIFANNNTVYAAAVSNSRGGFATVDVTDKENLALISGSDVMPPFASPEEAIVENGSGIGILVGDSALDLFDVSDPTNTNNFLTRINLSGNPNHVAVASGIAYVAGNSGLQVVNYLPFDNQGQAPDISIESSIEDINPNVEGIQVLAGTNIPIFSTITDDIQVQNLELLVNDVVETQDVSASFDFLVSSEDVGTISIQVRATDTGGNNSLSNELTFDILENIDITPPSIIDTVPDGDSFNVNVDSISVRLDEEIDTSLLNFSGITLTNLGANGVIGGGDDTVVAPDNIDIVNEQRFDIQIGNVLETGSYQLDIEPEIIADLAGNNLVAPFTLNFDTINAPEGTIFWISETDGNWFDAVNWSSGTVPDADDNVVINIPNANPIITIEDSSGAEVGNLFSEETIEIVSEGGFFGTTTLTINGDSVLNGDLITRRGESGTASDLVVRNAELIINGQVTFDGFIGEVQVLEGARIDFVEPITLGENIGILDFIVSGTDSSVDLSSLTSLQGTTFPGSRLQFNALNGGKIDLSNVGQITDGYVELFADGNNSEIDTSSLMSFYRTLRQGDSLIEARNGGTITIDNLTDLQGITLNLNNTSILSTSQIEVFQNGSINVDGITPDLNGLTDFNGSELIVSNGGTVTLPVTNYIGTSDSVSSVFRAEGTDSILDLSNLINLNENTFTNAELEVEAFNGGQINLSNITEIVQGKVKFLADGENSLIDLSQLTDFVKTGRGDSSLEARDNGTIIIDNLSNLQGITLNLGSTNSLSIDQIEVFQDGSVNVEGIAPDFNGLTNVAGSTFTADNAGVITLPANGIIITGSNYIAENGGTITLPISIYDAGDNSPQIRADGTGSTIDLSSVTELTTERSANRFRIDAFDGGQINLSNLPEIINTNARFTVDGSGSLIDISALNTFSGNESFSNSFIEVINNGNIQADNLSNLSRVNITSDNSIFSLLGLITVTDNTLAEALNGGTLNLNNLANIVDGTLTASANGTDSVINVPMLDGLVPEELNGGQVIFV